MMARAKSAVYIATAVLVGMVALLATPVSVQACTTCQSNCGQLSGTSSIFYQQGSYRVEYKNYSYYGCNTAQDQVLCTDETESKLNHEWIYTYKPAGSGYEKDMCNVCKCEAL